VFILSNDRNNYHSPTLNVIPITSKLQKRRLPVHVELLDYERFGLITPSVMLVEQIMTVSKSAISHFVGRIADADVFGQIREAMSVQFPIVEFCVPSNRSEPA